jgi:hypothetical protein
MRPPQLNRELLTYRYCLEHASIKARFYAALEKYIFCKPHQYLQQALFAKKKSFVTEKSLHLSLVRKKRIL